MKAVVIRGTEAVVDRNRPTPQLRKDCLLVKPVAVALNPTDWRNIKNRRGRYGCIVGCDYAGIVEAVGSDVTKSWEPGDRIFGCGHGANFVNPDDGVFAEYASVVGDLQMKIPTGLSFEEAATIGLGAITVGQGLYQKALKLQLPSTISETDSNGIPVLIYGGATATGALGIQYTKQSGYTVITTCSPKNFEYVTGLGADFALDYNDRDVANRIRKITQNELKYAWDTISIERSARICADALTTRSQMDPIYGSLLPVGSQRDDVRTVTTIMYTVFGRYFKFGPSDMPGNKEDFEFGKHFFDLTEQLVSQGRLRPHIHRVCSGGLDGIVQGLQDLEMGKVRAEKLVYLLRDTE